MKKNLLALALAAIFVVLAGNVQAQDDQDRAARRQQNQARMTERLVKDLKLTDEQKTKFEEIYGRYLEELNALRSEPTQEERQARQKKELTEEEAVLQITKYFENQDKMIQQMQARVDIQKKYLSEFSAILTNAQILRVLQPQMNRGGNAEGGEQGGRGGRGGFGGGNRGGFGGGGGFGGNGGDF